MTHVAITGSTGRVGGAVARLLSDAHLPTRLLVRDPARAPDLPHTEVVGAEYGNLPRTVAALRGIDTVFMTPIHDGSDHRTQHHDFVDAALQAGVRQVLYLSLTGADEEAIGYLGRHHGDTEAYLASSGLQYTFLRANFFAEVLEGFLMEDDFYAPVADGAVAPVARDDVAAAIATVLLDPRPHAGRTYELSGPRALDFHEIAAVLTDIRGEKHRFIDLTEDEARVNLASCQAPADVVEDWLSVYRAIRHGVHGHVTDDVRHLIGREPMSVAEALSHPQE